MRYLLQRNSSYLAGFSLLALGIVSVNAQTTVNFANVVFQDNFSGHTEGSTPDYISLGQWSTNPPAVVVDSGDLFGQGTANQFLQFTKARHIGIPISSGGSHYAHVGFSLIPRNLPEDTDFEDPHTSHPDHDPDNLPPLAADAGWFNINFLSGTDANPDATTRAHLTQLIMTNASVRTVNQSFGDVDELVHFDLFFNNSADEIQHLGPDGSIVALGAGMSSVWVNDSLLVADFNLNRAAGTDGHGINAVSFGIDSNWNRIVSFDMDDVFVAVPEPSTYAFLFGAGVFGAVLLIRRRRKS